MSRTTCQLLLAIGCLARSKKRLIQRSYRARSVNGSLTGQIMRLSHSQTALVLRCTELPLPREANLTTSLTAPFTLRLLACGIAGLPALATARSEFQIGKPGCHAWIPRLDDFRAGKPPQFRHTLVPVPW